MRLKILFLLLATFFANIESIEEKKDASENQIIELEEKKDNKTTDIETPKNETETSLNKVEEEQIKQPEKQKPLKINKIIIKRNNRNNYLSDQAILNSIPYREGEYFSSNKTSKLIRNLYEICQPFGFFNQIQVMGKVIDDHSMDLYIITYEKAELKEVIISGYKKIDKKDLDELYTFEDIHAINEMDLKRVVQEIKALYRDKNYHLVDIDAELRTDKDNKVTAIINIKENKKSTIRRVIFKGNCNIREKKLKEIIFTREDWVLGFLNKAGTYNPDNLEQDKRAIEFYYKSNGYFNAKVTDATVKMESVSKQYVVTFKIQEGDLYTINEVNIESDNTFPKEFLLAAIPVKPCKIYSARDIHDTIDFLKKLWGERGYIFADVSAIPIPDEDKKTINITFQVDAGDKVHVNKINILGNKKTKDYVIRRKLILDEGDLLTSTLMDESKDRVENLGYFDPNNGVNWKVTRINDNLADLDLELKEVKTGKLIAQMGYGGSPKNLSSISQSFRIGLSAYDTNLFGEGLKFNFDSSWSRQEWSLSFSLANPWLFNKPIYSEVNASITKSDYGEILKDTNNFSERDINAYLGLGYVVPQTCWLNETGITMRFGVEDLRYDSRPRARSIINTQANEVLQEILNRRFQPGTLIPVSLGLSQDTRNHSLQPRRGYQWSLSSEIGLNGGGTIRVIDSNGNITRQNNLGYSKIEAEASWYTPLIGEDTLIFRLHSLFGIVMSWEGRDIPYRKLYHLGGTNSVRGFLPGQISPMFLGNSIGGKKGFYVNAELIFPLTKDYSIKAIAFYDGGTGWDTPNADLIPEKDRIFLQNNKFSYRHAIGFGIKMLRPQPIQVFCGFKLDRRKGETPFEVHLEMVRDF